jgi:ATP synthase F1, gamma subunit
MKEIKRRRGSIQSTRQITKAMQLVSTVKLQKTRAKAEEAKPYFSLMYDTMFSILSRSKNMSHRFVKTSNEKEGKKAIIVISSNRGLAGGYNNNIARLVETSFSKEEALIYAIGKKAKDTLERRGYEILGEYNEVILDPMYQDAVDITKKLLSDYEEGKISEIYVVYTHFKNTVVHVPTLKKLLPISLDEAEKEEDKEKSTLLMNYAPNEEEVLEAIVPKYISAIIYGSLQQAIASENGARMNAMENATNNADELIDKLLLKYNRARQGAITQELTEIVAGANAI